MGYNSFDARLPLLSHPSGKINALQGYMEPGPLKLGPEVFHLPGEAEHSSAVTALRLLQGSW